MIQIEIKAPIGREYDGQEHIIKCMDSGVTFAVSLYTMESISPWREMAVPYQIPDGSTAKLRVTRPDRAYTDTKTTIQDGTILCPVHPYSVATPGKCSADVAVYGPDGDRLTSATFSFFVDRECAPAAGENAPVFVDSIQGLIEFVEQSAERAEAAADRAESSGGGNPSKDGITPHIGENGNWYIGTTDTGVSAEGEDGEDGGHYTPVVTQPTTDTIKIAFTPSKATMPAVAPVTVQLPAPSESNGAGEHPDNPVVDGITIGGENGVRFDSEGEPSTPVLALYGAQGDEPVRVSHVAPAQEDGEAVPLGQVKQLVKEHSGQNVNLDTTLTKSGEAADAKATGDEIKRVEAKIPNIEGLAKTEDIPTNPEDIGAQPAGNYASPDDIPKVPNWAMQTSKPAYAASEVGADPKGTAAAAVSGHNTSGDAHTDLRLEVKAIREQLAAFLDVDEETLNELSELIAAIAANQTSIEQLTAGKVNVSDIVNNLVTNVTNKPLSAAQGVELKKLIDNVSASLANYQPKGNYALESAVPTKVSQLQNDAKYLTTVTAAMITAALGYTPINPGVATLARHTDGLLYLFVDGKPVGSGVELPTGGIDGYITADKKVIFNNLPDGAYTLAYINDDGDIVPIGAMEKDTNVYYSITKNLTNCTISNSATQVIEGESYFATITAKSGYELESITVTMGVNPVEHAGGYISVANVTGDIVITAVAEEIKANYTNLADPTSADWLENTRISSSGFPTQTGITTSNWIPVTTGDVLRIKGIDVNTNQNARVALFGSTKNLLSSAKVSGLTSADVTGVTYDTTGAQFTIASTNAKFIRICGELKGAASDVIITKNEPIE